MLYSRVTRVKHNLEAEKQQKVWGKNLKKNGLYVYG